jgi:hypothetical protein
MEFSARNIFNCLMMILYTGLLISCDVKKSNVDPSEEFSKIYDHPDMNMAFYPIDAEQTSDGGFLILSVYTDTALSTFPLIYLIKTGRAGEKLWETWVDKAYCSAVPSLIPSDNNYLFVCMDAVNQETRVLQVNTSSGDISEFKTGALHYPLYCMKDSQGNIIVLNFDREKRISILSQYTDAFAEKWSLEFGIIDDVKSQIETHLAKTGRQFPFFIGEAGTSAISHYFVNCFYNYTMTLLFADAIEGSHTGTLYTYQDDAAVSSAVSVNGNRFALSRYYSGDNFVNPSVTLDPGAIQSVTDFTDFSIPELAPDAQVRCLHVTINEKDVIVYGSQTRTNQLVLYFYGAADSTLKSVRFYNDKYPVSLASMDYTQEGGLALLVQTYLIGRFPRINLIKLSPEDLEY